jgi:hypothetical protein
MADLAVSLARMSTVRHPAGVSFKTPLLVPSFSSKGFRLKDDERSVWNTLTKTCGWLTDTMLVSAYDLAHQDIPHPGELEATPELIFVDSGGYELQIDHDLSTVLHLPPVPKHWDRKSHQDELDRWPARFLATFVSYDEPSWRVPLAEQVAAAAKLFSRYPGQLHTILLKPELADQSNLTGTIASVAKAAHQLETFQFVGVTEKELGDSILDRMQNIATLRIALDQGGVIAPIHVFGALDPLSSLLFFLAGAEVFDGLTWLRYAYNGGLCAYDQNYGALAVGLHRSDIFVHDKIRTDNVHYLKRLSRQMVRFLLNRDFNMFEHHGAFLANVYNSLRSRLQGGV